MKVLFINITDNYGGAGKAMWRIAEEIDAETLFIVRDKHSDKDNVIEVKGNRIINIIFNLLGLQYKFLPRSRKIVKIAKKFAPDVISLNQIEGGYFQTRDIIKLSKIAPIFWTMHDEWAFNNNASSRALNKVERKIYPSIGIRWGDWLVHQKKKIYDKSEFQVICPSYNLFHKKLDSICDKAGHIIPHGVPDKFKPKKIYNLLYIAEKKSKAYQLDEILRRLDDLTEHKIILTIVGKGEFRGEYKNILIINRGFCSEDELLYYYQNSDVFIYPTQADAFGLVVLEALACGLPVVCSEIIEIVEHNVNGYKAKDPEGFARYIEFLIHHRWVREDMALKARYSAEKYDIKKIAKEYEKLWDSILTH